MTRILQPNQLEHSRDCDELLQRYLSSNASDRQSLEERLIEEFIGPLVRKIIRRQLGVDVSHQGGQQGRREDISQDIYVNILLSVHKQLERWYHRDASPPKSLLGYVAMAAYHGCKQAYSRAGQSSSPDASLQVHAILTRKPGFAVWKATDGMMLAGYSAWKEAGRKEADDTVTDTLVNEPLEFAAAGLRIRNPSKSIEAADTVELMMALLDRAGAPLEFSACVSAFQQCMSLKAPEDDVGPIVLTGEPGEGERDILQNEVASSTNIEEQVTDEDNLRSFARKLWKEIATIPLNQRKALLLNFPDWDIRQLTSLGVASFENIATVLGYSLKQLASVWNVLPLDDEAIAQDLSSDLVDGGKTYDVAAVRNYRQSAYRTVSWRLRPYDRGILKRLWQAALTLVPMRPAAFWLYLRDNQGASLLALLPREGYANQGAIAEALRVPVEEIKGIWHELPLGFRMIGSLIHRPPQAVALMYSEACEALGSRLDALKIEPSLS